MLLKPIALMLMFLLGLVALLFSGVARVKSDPGAFKSSDE